MSYRHTEMFLKREHRVGKRLEMPRAGRNTFNTNLPQSASIIKHRFSRTSVKRTQTLVSH